MTTTRAWGAPAAGAPLEALTVERRELRSDDLRIAIEFAGICHSDIHTVRGEFGPRQYPLVPGHEIVGHVTEVGAEVTSYQVGDRVGVGCFVNSCGECLPCQAGEESYCANGPVMTFGHFDRYADGEYTQGGYSQEIVVRESFVVRIPEALPMDKAAPLLCAGITMYSPLKKWDVGPNTRVAVVGMGGLGHVAVKIAVAMGAEVTVFSHSARKRDDALAFGARDLVATRDGLDDQYAGYFDVILNTVSVDLDVNAYMGLLRYEGVFIQLGLPDKPLEIPTRTLTGTRRVLTGSLVGGIRETQEMLDFCAAHGVTPEIELIDATAINEAYDRTVNSEVRYRFVIDTSTM